MCGFEFRDAKGSTAVKELASQIQELEEKKQKQAAKSNILSAFMPKEDFSAQEIELIRNFSIPNTKEDIYEFVILATSNINPDSYQNKNVDPLSSAWMAKAEQAYHKAEITFGDDPDFENVRNVYNRKMKAVKSSTRIQYLIAIGGLLFLLLFL